MAKTKPALTKAEAMEHLVSVLCEEVERASTEGAFGGIPESSVYLTLQGVWPNATLDHAYKMIALMVRTGRVKRTDYHLLVAA